jgi:hypothetical protein
MNPITLQLTFEQFAALGSHIPGPRSPLSPLPPVEPADAAVDQQLVRAGLLGPAGQAPEPLGSLFSILGKTAGMVEMSWMDPAGETRNVSLYSPKTLDGSAAWAPTRIAESSDGRLVLRSPCSRAELQAELLSVLGPGDLASLKMDPGLTAPQALALAALMDGQASPGGVTASMVLDLLQGTAAPAGLKRVILLPLLTLVPSMDWTLDSVQHVLNSLVRMGWCTLLNETAYSLSEPLRRILAGAAAPRQVIWLTFRRSEAEAASDMEAEHIVFSFNATNLVFSWSNGAFQLKTFSTAELAGLIAGEVTPVTLPPLPRPVAPAVLPASMPVKKKKVPKGLIAGLVGVLLFACILLVVGMVLLLV